MFHYLDRTESRGREPKTEDYSRAYEPQAYFSRAAGIVQYRVVSGNWVPPDEICARDHGGVGFGFSGGQADLASVAFGICRSEGRG